MPSYNALNMSDLILVDVVTITLSLYVDVIISHRTTMRSNATNEIKTHADIRKRGQRVFLAFSGLMFELFGTQFQTPGSTTYKATILCLFVRSDVSLYIRSQTEESMFTQTMCGHFSEPFSPG